MRERSGARVYEASDGSLWDIVEICPPVPTRAFDWEWISQDYGGPGDNRHGNAASEEACIAAIEEYIKESRDAS